MIRLWVGLRPARGGNRSGNMGFLGSPLPPANPQKSRPENHLRCHFCAVLPQTGMIIELRMQPCASRNVFVPS